MTQQASTQQETVATVRINCGVDYQAHQGFGAYSAMVKVGDEQLEPIAGVVDEDATFIRCCLMAAVKGIEAVEPTGETVEIVMPSTWVAETVGNPDRLAELRAKDWINDDGEEIVHRDLLERLAGQIDRHEKVSWTLAQNVGRRGGQQEAEGDSSDDDAAGELAPDCHISYAAATVGNSGVGAYYIELKIPGKVEKVSSKFQTTNFARMHLTACIDALRETRRLLRKRRIADYSRYTSRIDCECGEPRLVGDVEPEPMEPSGRRPRSQRGSVARIPSFDAAPRR